jgi:hypothetical protein
MDLPDVYVDFIQELNTNGKHAKDPIKDNDNIMKISTQTHFCKLKKAIYGLVQSAGQWWKNIREVILQMGYKPSILFALQRVAHKIIHC